MKYLINSYIDSFKELLKAVPEITDIYFNTDETGYGATRDQEMRTFFKEQKIQVHEFMDGYLHGAREETEVTDLKVSLLIQQQE